MLILAGITINLVFADGGIIKKAQDATEAQKKAEVTDLVSIMLTEAKVEKMVYKRELLDFLTEKQKDGKLDSVTDNGDGTITIEKNGYTFIIDEKTTKILEISKNTRTVRIALDKTVAKLNEEVTATIEIIGEEIKEVLKWELTAESGNLGTDESKYTNEYTSNEIKLAKATEGTYYLHLLVKDKSGNKEEKISAPIKIMPNPVESITLDKTTIELEKGATATLTATVLPENASKKTINWKSSDETVATVVSTGDNTAEITALKAGNTKITAEATDGSEVKSEECTVTVTQKVTVISLSETTATVEIGKTKILTATITPEDATNKELTWTSSATSVATVDNTGTVTGVSEGTATITVATTDGSGKTATCTVTVVEAESDWKLLSKIAEEISNNSSTITKTDNSATVTVNGTSYTLNVGDTYKVKYNGEIKTVRIIGFNHDKLAKPTTTYDGNNTYAGISFDFVDFMTGTTYKQMNTSNTNANGWAATQMRKDLNGYTTTAASQSGSIGGLGSNLSNKEYIKQVKKDYLPTYNSSTISSTPSEDYLWLLSCAEIWSTGYNSTGKGYAMGIEGSQYKWYANNEKQIAYNSANSNFVKKASTSDPAYYWWLRSPYYNDSNRFCIVRTNGYCSGGNASNSRGVAPGFSI